MINNRPIDSEHIREVLNLFTYACDRKDLSGGIYLVDREEVGFTYHMPASWNAFIDDRETPFGFRIRAKKEELGIERAKELIEGSAFVVGAMQQIGLQTRLWGQDLQKLMEQNGKMKFHHNWPKIPRFSGFPGDQKPPFQK